VTPEHLHGFYKATKETAKQAIPDTMITKVTDAGKTYIKFENRKRYGCYAEKRYRCQWFELRDDEP